MACHRTRFMVSLCVLALTLACFPPADAALRAGAAAVDITPTQFPLNLPGGFRANIAKTAHDPLHASAMVLTNGKKTVALVVVDNLGVDPTAIEAAKVIAAKQTKIPRSNMLICSTHTHSAPTSFTTQGAPAEVAYRKQLIDGMAASIIKAHAALEPASIGAGSHALPEEVFNRRWFLKEGKMPANPFGKMDKVKMNPPRRDDTLLKPAGRTDPDVMVIAVRDAKKKPLALLANYALHYVGGVPRGEVSADYFGEFARLMPSRLRAGDQFVAMMSNGASGDINNIPFTVTRPPRKPYEQINIVARKAADAAWFAHRKIETYHDQHDIVLDMVEREITLHHRKPSEAQVARARQILAIVATNDEAELKKLPRLADAYARRTIQAFERPRTLKVKLQAIRIENIAIVGIPFEVFVEIGLDLKQQSTKGAAWSHIMVIGLANGRHGYLPTPEQHNLGGYETWLGTNIVQKDASVIVTEQLKKMMRELQ